MRAVRLYGARDFRLERMPHPRKPRTGEVLVGIRAVGICGSDLHLYTSGGIGSIRTEQPLIPGHEFMGKVMAIGPRSIGADGSALTIGQRVAVEPHIPCHHCEWCEAGNPNLCPNHRFLGVPPNDGALCEFLLVPARQCFVLPKSISDGAGALLEPLGVALHAVDLAKIKLGNTVVVAGGGPIGLMIGRLAILAGAKIVIVVDPLAHRTALARQWGVTHALTTKMESAVDRVRKITGPRGADVVFEVAWAGTALPACLQVAGPGTKVVLVGIPDDDDCRFVHSEARRKGLTLLFSRRMKQVYPRAIKLTEGRKPKIALDELISHQFSLSQTAKAFDLNARYADKMIKGVIHPYK